VRIEEFSRESFGVQGLKKILRRWSYSGNNNKRRITDKIDRVSK